MVEEEEVLQIPLKRMVLTVDLVEVELGQTVDMELVELEP
jgi:hypothetical protein